MVIECPLSVRLRAPDLASKHRAMPSPQPVTTDNAHQTLSTYTKTLLLFTTCSYDTFTTNSLKSNQSLLSGSKIGLQVVCTDTNKNTDENDMKTTQQRAYPSVNTKSTTLLIQLLHVKPSQACNRYCDKSSSRKRDLKQSRLMKCSSFAGGCSRDR